MTLIRVYLCDFRRQATALSADVSHRLSMHGVELGRVGRLQSLVRHRHAPLAAASHGSRSVQSAVRVLFQSGHSDFAPLRSNTNKTAVITIHMYIFPEIFRSLCKKCVRLQYFISWSTIFQSNSAILENFLKAF